MQLATEGFNAWKNISSRLKGHECSNDHIICMSRWIETETRMRKRETIDKSLQEKMNNEKDYWRQVLLRIIALVKTLSQQNLALRGSNETLFEDGNGNFLKFIEMMAIFDHIMQEHVRRIQMSQIHTHYLGPKIQNELIQLLASEVKCTIVEKIKKAKYFSIILDVTPDSSHEEQMTLVIRCVDVTVSPVKVEEYFLGFLKVDDTTGLGLFSELEEALKNLQLDIKDIRGQGYDNGSNMKGRHKGVQKRLLDRNPRAFYVPCGCHSLNLALSDMAGCCSQGKNFFGIIQRIYCLFSASTKRWGILKNNVSGLTLKPLSQTRWESRLESVKPLLLQTEEIRNALLDLANSNEDGAATSEALGFVTNELENFEFLLTLVIWYDLLSFVNIVSKTLQNEEMHMDVALEQLKGLIILFEKYRETGYEKAKNEAEVIAKKMGIQPIFQEKRVSRRKKHFDENNNEDVMLTSEESFRINFVFFVIDQALTSLRVRFEDFQKFEDMFGFLWNIKKWKLVDDESLESSCMKLEEHLKCGTCSDVNGRDLFSELRMLRELLPKEIEKAIGVLNYLKEMNTCFPNAWIAYRILLTVPVTVAFAERSFSKLKLLKSYLRSTMSQERLNGLAILSIEKHITGKLDFTSLIDKFAAKKARKIIFYDW
ncbi:hypothetical protein ABFS82_13G051800 [Erythranthe guttata]